MFKMIAYFINYLSKVTTIRYHWNNQNCFPTTSRVDHDSVTKLSTNPTSGITLFLVIEKIKEGNINGFTFPEISQPMTSCSEP